MCSTNTINLLFPLFLSSDVFVAGFVFRGGNTNTLTLGARENVLRTMFQCLVPQPYLQVQGSCSFHFSKRRVCVGLEPVACSCLCVAGISIRDASESL
jgi:hypothetical protein